MHGGQLELSSRIGHGSRFTFKLKAFAEEVD
jgi:signal transduction histidine kinase